MAGLKISYTFYLKLAKALKLKRTDANLPSKKKVAGKVSAKRVAVPTWPEFVTYILKTNIKHDVGHLAALFSPPDCG